MEAVDSRKIDPNFKFEIAKQEGGEGILKCYACGTCTARCPEMDVKEEWNPRTVIRKALLGLKEEVLTSEFIWICSAHYRCLEKCPQKVNVKGLMNQIREQRIRDEEDGVVVEGRDDSFKYMIAEGESGGEIYNCFSCGTCTCRLPRKGP